MTYLPTDMIYTIALHAPIDDILSLCQGNKQLNTKICNNEKFWETKTKLLFPEEWKIKDEISPITWKKFYLNLTNGEYFPVFIRGSSFKDSSKDSSKDYSKDSSKKYIYLTPTMSIREMYEKIIKKFKMQVVKLIFNEKYDASKPIFHYLFKGTDVTYNNVNLWDYIYGFEIYNGRYIISKNAPLFDKEYPPFDIYVEKYDYGTTERYTIEL